MQIQRAGGLNSPARGVEMQRACQKIAAWHGSCSSLPVARTENNLGRRERGMIGAWLAVATTSMDVTRKQRFGSCPTVFAAIRGEAVHACRAASFAPGSGTHATSGTNSAPRRAAITRFGAVPGTGEQRVKRTVCARNTHEHPVIGCEYFLFTGCCGARATKQR